MGVARQYYGQVGKQENCQTAVSLSIATHQAGLPVAYRLYLPKEWADDAARRSKAGVPEDVTFQTKPEIALQQMRQALADGVTPAVALADPAYGNNSGFRAGITELGLAYAVGIMPATTVWRPGEAPIGSSPVASPRATTRGPPPPRSGRGRGATRQRRDKRPQPVSVKALASQLPLDAWQQISWRMGSSTVLASRFARLRIRVPHGAPRDEPAAEECRGATPRPSRITTGCPRCQPTSRSSAWSI